MQKVRDSQGTNIDLKAFSHAELFMCLLPEFSFWISTASNQSVSPVGWKCVWRVKQKFYTQSAQNFSNGKCPSSQPSGAAAPRDSVLVEPRGLSCTWDWKSCCLQKTGLWSNAQHTQRHTVLLWWHTLAWAPKYQPINAHLHTDTKFLHLCEMEGGTGGVSFRSSYNLIIPELSL